MTDSQDNKTNTSNESKDIHQEYEELKKACLHWKENTTHRIRDSWNHTLADAQFYRQLENIGL